MSKPFRAFRARRHALAVAAAPILLTLAAAPAVAAEAPATVDQVVITADKRGAAGVQDVPLSVTGFDGRAIETLGVTEFDDLMSFVPGANFIDNGGPGRGNEIASIRGLSPVADNTAGVVARYLDGAPRSGNNYRLFDIGEVAVLRGPQGTLWGSQAVGGLVSIRSNRPSLSGVSGLAQGDVYGSKDDGGLSYRLNGYVNLPISDYFALRVAAQTIDESGYVDNIASGRDDVNTVEETSWRVSALFKPTESVDVTFIYHGDDLHSDAPSYFAAGRDLTTDNPLSYRPADQRFDLYNLIVEARLGWADLSLSSSYFDLNNVYYEGEVDALGIPGVLGSVKNTLGQKSWTHELRLSSPRDSEGRLGWIAGVYVDDLDENDLIEETEILNPLVPGDTPTYAVGFPLMTLGGPERTKETAVFGELSYRVTDQWEVLVGARWFDWSINNQQQFTYFGSSNYQQTTGEIGGTDSFHKVQVNWRPTDDLLVYALRSEGFRFGGFNPFAGPLLGIPLDFVQYDPDTLINYELGVKGDLLERRLTYAATVYFAEWQDIQTVVFNQAGNFAFTTNAPNLEAKGLELEVATRDLLAPGLTLSASYAYTENEFTEDARVYPGVRALVSKGEELRRTPRQTWSINAGYDFEVAGKEVFLRANYWHRDRTTTEGFNGGDGDIYVPAQDVVNASAGVRFGPNEVKLYVDNLTDERPWLQVFPAAANSTAADEVSSIRPRTVGVQLTRRFGQ